MAELKMLVIENKKSKQFSWVLYKFLEVMEDREKNLHLREKTDVRSATEKKKDGVSWAEPMAGLQ